MVGNLKPVQNGVTGRLLLGGATSELPCTRRVPHFGKCIVLALFALSEINKLRVISEGQNSDSSASTNP